MNSSILILRLGAAAAAGVIIGINRDLTNKPIGMRTLGLVSLGAAVVSLATIQFEDLAAHPDAESRRAGYHPRHHGRDKLYRCRCYSTPMPQARTVEGLTTAATVWVTAALGIACGLAAWTIVGVALVIALILLVALGWMEGVYSTQLKPSSTAQQK